MTFLGEIHGKIHEVTLLLDTAKDNLNVDDPPRMCASVAEVKRSVKKLYELETYLQGAIKFNEDFIKTSQ